MSSGVAWDFCQDCLPGLPARIARPGCLPARLDHELSNVMAAFSTGWYSLQPESACPVSVLWQLSVTGSYNRIK